MSYAAEVGAGSGQILMLAIGLQQWAQLAIAVGHLILITMFCYALNITLAQVPRKISKLHRCTMDNSCDFNEVWTVNSCSSEPQTSCNSVGDSMLTFIVLQGVMSQQWVLGTIIMRVKYTLYAYSHTTFWLLLLNGVFFTLIDARLMLIASIRDTFV